MAKTKISEFSATPANNTDIDSINIAEGCAPSGINDAIRELMSQLKDFQTGAVGDSFNGPINGTLGATTPATASVTTLTTSSTITHNGGTANGVTYLNGSKVLTSGSTLVYDGSNLGVGAAPDSKFYVGGGALGTIRFFFNGTSVNYNDVDTQIWRTAAASESMRLNSSGNLGLGVTPYASTGVRAFDLANYGTLNTWDDSTLSNIQLGMNFYQTGSTFNYKVTSSASMYRQRGNVHSWYNAPSGTINTAITFTQAMTLDASGNLLVGTTSASGILHVNGVQDGVAGKNARFSYSGTYYLEVNETSIRSFNNPLVFGSGTSGTERAQIDANGNLLVGTVNTGLRSNRSMGFVVSGACVQYISHSTSDVSGNSYVEFGYNATKIGSITQSGTTAVLYNVTSDQRLKENIVDAPEFGSVIDSIKVRSFDWITDQTHQRAGFIAQELVTVAPEAVNQPNDPEDMMAVDYSKLVPMLVKEIQSLRVRVAQLETN